MEEEIQSWRETPDHNSTGFGPYLPETYFNTKRSWLQRPFTQENMDTNNVVKTKRIRLGPSPVEHRELAALKKMERESTKAALRGVCSSHRTLIDIPIHVLRCLQNQGATLNRTQEAMDLLMMQVNDFSNKLEVAIARTEGINKIPNNNSPSGSSKVVSTPAKPSSSFAPTQQRPASSRETKLPMMDSHQFDLFEAYYQVVCQMSTSFKRMRGTSRNSSSTSADSSGFGDGSSTSVVAVATSLRSAPQYLMIQHTLECINRIRYILISQCNFDCDLPPVETNLKWPPAQGAVSLWRGGLSSRAPTWDDVCESLDRMQFNMRKYLEYVEVQRKLIKGRSLLATRTENAPQQQRTESSSKNISKSMLEKTPQPIHASTPLPTKVYTKKKTPSPIVKKRKAEAEQPGDVEVSMDNHDQSVPRKKLMPRRVSFSFTPTDAMEVD